MRYIEPGTQKSTTVLKKFMYPQVNIHETELWVYYTPVTAMKRFIYI